MSELADAIQAIGLPVVGLGTAAGIYKLSGIIEKTARPEVLKDIARALKETSVERWAHGQSPIPALFNATFGSRQWSWKCMRRSISASFLGLVAIAISFPNIRPYDESIWFELRELWRFFILGVIFYLIVPDFLAIWKTRASLKLLGKATGPLFHIGLCALDIISSLAISYVFFVFQREFMILWRMAGAILTGSMEDFPRLVYIYTPIDFVNHFVFLRRDGIYLNYVLYFEFVNSYVYSTLLTSVWIIFTTLSVSALRLLIPLDYLRRFTTWFFDVDKHPIQAIGLMAGVIVFAGSLLWQAIRWIV